MRAWMVRAGTDGERELAALKENRAIAGWADVPDLSHCETKSDLRSILKSVYGEDSSTAVIGNWAGQLWRFRNEMTSGDIILMPLKSGDRGVAMGRITGDYYYKIDEAPDNRHSRPVQWIQPNVDREAFGGDILSSLGSLLTICEVSRPNVIERLTSMLDGERDSGDGDNFPENLGELAAQVAERPVEITIRRLLEYKGYKRRTSGIVADVSNELAELGLLAVPPISEGWLDGTVRIVPSPNQVQTPAQGGAEQFVEVHEVEEAEAETDRAIGGSVKYAVGTMDTANRRVLCAGMEDSLRVVVTKMALMDYSQIAVVDDDNRLLGALTWESIALAWMSGQPQLVKHAVRAAPSTRPGEELLAQAENIYGHGFVFVCSNRGRVQGIITSADLTKRFGDDHRPIVLLDEIEQRLAHRILSSCTESEIKQAGVKVGRGGYTFGNYVRALSSDALWMKLRWSGLDRAEFQSVMSEVRDIRNSLMHFSPDPITDEEIDKLEHVARTLRLITEDLDGVQSNSSRTVSQLTDITT